MKYRNIAEILAPSAPRQYTRLVSDGGFSVWVAEIPPTYFTGMAANSTQCHVAFGSIVLLLGRFLGDPRRRPKNWDIGRCMEPGN